MQPDDFDPILRKTLGDQRMTRRERRDVRDALESRGLDHDGLAFVRHRAFALASEELPSEEAQRVLGWLEEVIKTLAALGDPGGATADVHFSPGKACLEALIRELNRSARSVDVCVFTITDDRLVEPLLAAHERGVTVRIISDDLKSEDRGSDVERLRRAGLAVRTDHSEHHMHHKFAVFDGRTVATGSYNWTRSAARHNRENLAICDDPRLLCAYREAFDRLWRDLGAQGPSESG